MIAKEIDIAWHPGLSVFASETFLKFYGDEYGWLGGFDGSDTLCCILPFTIIRKAVFRLVRFRVATIPVTGDFSLADEKRFLNSAMEYFRERRIGMVMPGTNNAIFNTYPDGATAAPYGTFIIDLTQSEEALWSNLHQKHRNVIRNAMKKGVEVREGQDQADIAFRLVTETLKRSRMKFMARRPYEKFVNSLKDNIKIFVAYADGVAQGCAIMPYSAASAYYLYGGSSEKPLSGANNFLQWEAMKTFKQLGVRQYDFVGVRINPAEDSKQESLMVYKQRFGGRLLQGYMWKYQLQPLTSAAYSTAVRGLKGGDIVDVEGKRNQKITRTPAARLLLIHAGWIPHYRVPVYNHLSRYLEEHGFSLAVISDGIQSDNPYAVDFSFTALPLSTLAIVQHLLLHEVDIIIDYMELRHRYLFPTYLMAKILMGKKMIYWGQGCDLADTNSRIKNLAYALEQSMCDAIILYAEHLKKYVPVRFHKKIFIANNTIYNEYAGLPPDKTRDDVLRRYGIRTKKNVICMGRIQRRKRINKLVEAFGIMNRPDVGLILVGPDSEGAARSIEGPNIYKTGPIYGKERYDLLSASDVFCLPGAVGLSVIDAFQCGLPFITEEGDESAEMMYLKDGVNSFIVPRDDTREMSEKILDLIDHEEVRQKFSEAARKEIADNGSIEKMCEGFLAALMHVKAVDPRLSRL